MAEDINISIITVCFNSAQTIAKTLESVLSQDFDGLEYVIVDGGSTDGTLEIIDRYKSRYAESTFKVISEPDEGIYDAMNKGISLARGKLIGIINSDDWYEPECFNRVWNEYQASGNKDAVFYGAMNIYRNGKLEEIIYSSHEFLREKMIAHPTCFVAKSVYETIGVFDCRYKLAADYDFLLRAYDNKVRFVGIKHILANFTRGGASASRKLEKDERKIQYRHGIHSRTEHVLRMGIYYVKESMFYIKVLIRKITKTEK